MLSTSTLAPASSRMWAASTFPASTAQCSGVFLFTLSTALTEALFFIRKLVGSGLETAKEKAKWQFGRGQQKIQLLKEKQKLLKINKHRNQDIVSI